jgi:hypothetical protein
MAIHIVKLSKMNNDEDLEESIIGFDALYSSMHRCKSGVIWKDSVAHFVLNGIEETIKLEKELKDGTYTARQPVPFRITSPKPRDIISISFRDRVYQRSLNDNTIYPEMTKHFIYDNGACQKNKGTDFARDRLKCFLQRFYRKYGTDGYVFQCDIHGYYPNMRHDVAKNTFREHLDDVSYERAVEVLDGQYQGDIGYNAGSQMIQIAGISVLNKLDHFIKEQLHIKYYIRYMDDLILIHKDKEYLNYCKAMILIELNDLGFEFNPTKTRIYKLKEGILFLGFTYRLTSTGKVLLHINSKNVRQERKKLVRLVNLAKKGELSKDKVDQCFDCWCNHAGKGNSYRLLLRMRAYYEELWRNNDECC